MLRYSDFIPNGWAEVKLEEVTQANPANSKPKENPEVSFLGMADISEEGKILNYNTVFYNDVSKGFTSFQNNDVLVAKITPCFENRKGALVSNLKNGIGFGSTEFHVIRAGKKVLPEYIHYHTRTHAFRSRGTSNMTGSAGQKRVPTDFIKHWHIPLPPLPEQRKIAAILKPWDMAIRLTESLIAKKQRHKKALMQRLLTGTTRFPGFAGQAWREVHLTDVATVVFSNVDKKTHNDETTVRLCNYMDVFRNDYITDDLRFMEATATSAEIKKFTLNTGDVVFTKDSETADEIAESTVVAEKLNNVICGYHLGIIRPDDKELDGFFLSLLLKAPEVRHQFIRLANGVTRYGLNLGSVHLIKLSIPSVAEQQAIAEVFIALDQEIHLLQTKLAALRGQKRGLMQRLLTGKLRVSVEDEPLTQPQEEQNYG